jgi:hypothetical protein
MLIIETHKEQIIEEQEYWFNTKTGEVEQGKQTLAFYRIGPFKTRGEAEHALETLAKRSSEWKEEEQED